MGLGSGWMPEEFAAASAAHIFPRRHKHVRETIEIMQGIWTNDLFEYHGEFADFDRCRFGAKPVSKTLDDLKRLKEEIMPKVDAT